MISAPLNAPGFLDIEMQHRRFALSRSLFLTSVGLALGLMAATAGSDEVPEAASDPTASAKPDLRQEMFEAVSIPIARVGSIDITYEDLWVRVREDPTLLRSFGEAQGRAEVLRRIIETVLINQAALERAELPADADSDALLRAVTEFESQEFAPDEVSDERLQAVYAERRETLGIPASARVREIFFPVPSDADTVTREAARQAALKTLQRIEAGEDFGALAGELAHSQMLRLLAGDQGYLPLTLHPLLKPAVEDLRVGEHSDVLELPGGYQIIELLGRRDAILSPFESVSDRLRGDLEREASERKRRAFLDSYGDKVGVQVLAPELKSAWPASAGPR